MPRRSPPPSNLSLPNGNTQQRLVTDAGDEANGAPLPPQRLGMPPSPPQPEHAGAHSSGNTAFAASMPEDPVGVPPWWLSQSLLINDQQGPLQVTQAMLQDLRQRLSSEVADGNQADDSLMEPPQADEAEGVQQSVTALTLDSYGIPKELCIARRDSVLLPPLPTASADARDEGPPPQGSTISSGSRAMAEGEGPAPDDLAMPLSPPPPEAKTSRKRRWSLASGDTPSALTLNEEGTQREEGSGTGSSLAWERCCLCMKNTSDERLGRLLPVPKVSYSCNECKDLSTNMASVGCIVWVAMVFVSAAFGFMQRALFGHRRCMSIR